jgi:hypothetical protein
MCATLPLRCPNLQLWHGYLRREHGICLCDADDYTATCIGRKIKSLDVVAIEGIEFFAEELVAAWVVQRDHSRHGLSAEGHCEVPLRIDWFGAERIEH